MALALTAVAGGNLAYAADSLVASAHWQGEFLVVLLEMLVPVRQQLAWDVLTDFEHMRAFVPGIESNEVIERSKTRVVVRQEGVASVGPFSLPYTSVREILLDEPRTIDSRSIGGSGPVTLSHLALHADASGTRVSYRLKARDLPAFAGFATDRFAESVRRQFAALRAEMLRRNAGN